MWKYPTLVHFKTLIGLEKQGKREVYPVKQELYGDGNPKTGRVGAGCSI
jgi:hypothetical protein